MNIPPNHSIPATGDIGLSSALNALGVPPAGEKQFQPVKSMHGDDFVRIYLGPMTIDGKRKTTDLMKQWRNGPESVVNLPADPFSSLQVWTKTRAALIALRKGIHCWIGRVGVWPAVVTVRDRDRWLVPGSGSDLRSRTLEGFTPDNADLEAALIVLGVKCLGVDSNAGLTFCENSLKSTLHAHECAAKWPEMVEDKDSPAAYCAAASQARTMSMAVIHGGDPTLYLRKAKASAWLSQRKLEEGDKKTVKLANKIGL
jgi:hypothetical protein